MRSLWQRLFSRNSERADDRPAAKGFRPQFEALERRENPAGQSDALIWGNSWEHFQVGSNNRLMVNYSSNGGRVQTVDLSTALNSTTFFSAGNAALAATTFGNNPYVFVRASGGDLHTFYWTGGRWAEANLSAAANYTPNVRPFQIAAQVWNGIPHVFFVGEDLHVHELYWSAASGWRGVDLTVASGTTALASSNNTIAAVVAGDGTERVYYQSTDNHVRELRWSSDAGWADSDVSGLGQIMYYGTYELSAYALGNAVYVAYQGANQHIYQLANSGGSWTSTDLHAVVGFGATKSTTDLQAYYVNGAYCVAYAGDDDRLRLFSWRPSTGWSNTDLTFTTNASAVYSSGTGRIAYLQINSTQTLFYHDANGRISRMFNWDPLIGWQNVIGWYY